MSTNTKKKAITKLASKPSATKPAGKSAIKPVAKPAGKSARKRPAPKLHIREAPSKDSPTLCGGSHSPIWNLSGDRPLQSVPPQKAKDATCGRCMRVARSSKREML